MSLPAYSYYHEAGHALAAVRFNFVMHCVEVFPDAPWDAVAGQIQVRVPVRRPRRTRATTTRLEHAVVMVIAGDQAAALYQVGRRRAGDQEDRQLACQWLAWLYPTATADDLVRQWYVFRRYTRWFLLNDWAAVDALAQQLMQTPRLSVRQVRRLIRAVSP
jgi:hypothetical protein